MRSPATAAQQLRRAVLRALVSRRLAVAVMGLLAGVLAAATLVPPPPADPGALEALRDRRPAVAWLSENLQPQDVARSHGVYALAGYLFAAIGYSVVQRVRAFSRTRLGDPVERAERFRTTRSFVVAAPPDEAGRRLAAILRRGGYRVAAGERGVHGTRGELGFAGSIAFHLGMMLVLAGVVASALTRVSGELVLTEGFAAPVERASFTRLTGTEELSELEGLSARIDDFVPEYAAGGTPMQFSLLLELLRDGRTVEQAVVRVNEKLSFRGYALLLGRYGFAPDLSATDAGGAVQLDAVGVLQLLPPGRTDALPLADGGSLELRLYPDHVDAPAGPASRSLAPHRPVLYFTWRDPGGATVAEGRVARGREALVAGRRVRFRALSYWAGFVLTRDAGVWLLALGSLLGSLGLFLRLAFPDQTASATVAPCPGGAAIRLVASTRYFPAIHEAQVDHLVDGLAPSRAP